MEAGRCTVLLVDDDPQALMVYGELCREWGYGVVSARGTLEAMELMRQGAAPTVVVSDLRMPDPDGLVLFRWLQANHPSLPVIILTGYGSIDSAVEAISEGAFHYLAKPPEPEQLRSIIEKARTQVALAQEVDRLRERLREAGDGGALVGRAPLFARAVELAATVAASEAPVLILGETGTGKELLARFIHRRSRRASGACVSLNCGALPANLIESELFGHERGAFTGAVASRPGRFEEADGGTVFLDEVGDCPLDLQVKLLRVLESKEFCRLGSNRPVRSDFRLVAATNRDLAALVREGRFREDLYFRINVMEIRLPSLRERMDDLPALAWHFMRGMASREGKEIQGLSRRTLEILHAYGWPGNVRELENVIHRGVILADGPLLRPEHLPTHLLSAPHDLVDAAGWNALPHVSLAECERLLINGTLVRCGGNKSQASRELGISRKVLYAKMRRHQIVAV